MTKILAKTKEINPVVHCVASYLNANDIANTILAIGGTPIIACNEELQDISDGYNSLSITNIGLLTQSTAELMLLVAKSAKTRNIPIILHVMGTESSLLRRQVISKLIKQSRPDIIKGSFNEINMLAELNFYKDTDNCEYDLKLMENDIDAIIEVGKIAQQNTQAIIVITGKKNLVIDKNKITILDNGSDVMNKISNAGCMTAVIATLVGTNKHSDLSLYDSCVEAVSLMSCAAELAQFKMRETQTGLGCFRMYLIDYLNNMDDLLLKNMQNNTLINY